MHRIEHPQPLIDRLQYGEADAAAKVLRGRGPYPVAEYRLAAEVSAAAAAAAAASSGGAAAAADAASHLGDGWYQPMLAGGGGGGQQGGGDAAAAAAAGQAAGEGESARAVFSFCMCPGGQIVPTSSSEEELCINGMSFSRWAGVPVERRRLARGPLHAAMPCIVVCLPGRRGSSLTPASRID
jgi:hypothetical protein